MARAMVQQRLLEIAVREFGLKGLEGASTRGIAAAAGTAMSSITYHYGGKEGLYLAAADHIAAQMGGRDGAGAIPDRDVGDDPDEARAAIQTIARADDRQDGERADHAVVAVHRPRADEPDRGVRANLCAG